MSEDEIDRKIAVIFATDVVGYSKLSVVIESWSSDRLEHWRLWFVCVIDYAACF